MANFLHVLAWNQLAVLPLAGTVWVISRARLFRERPAIRHGFWLLVLLKFIAPALIPLAFLPAVADERNSKPQLHTDGVKTTQNMGVALGDPPIESAESWRSVVRAINDSSEPRHTLRIWLPMFCILALSLLVSVWLWVTAIRQVCRIRQLLSRSGCEPRRAVAALQDVSRCFVLQKEPRLLVVDESISPMLWAESGHLTIVLPRTLTMSIGDAQLRHILAHELAHFVRRDHWGNMLSFFVTSLFWWNPIAWVARRELRSAAESCCDAMAINRLAGSRKSYAETLLTVVDFVTSSKAFDPTVATTFGESRSLKRRIEMIANPNVKTSLSRSGLLLVACGVVSLAMVPARAQQEGPITSSTATETSEAPSPGAGSSDASMDRLPGAKAKSSLGAEANSDSRASMTRRISTAIMVLANNELQGKALWAEVRRVRVQTVSETDPGSMELVLHIKLIPTEKGAAPLDWKSVHVFFDHWVENVAARGVKMLVERIVGARQGNGVDLEVSLTLPPAQATGARTKLRK